MNRIAGDRIVEDREVARYINRLPETMAAYLQNVVRRNHIDHVREIAASSTFKIFNTKQLRLIIRARPAKAIPTGGSFQGRLDDIVGETWSPWQGPSDDMPEGAAAKIEKSIGPATIRPVRRRFLRIPVGPMQTPKGRPRRKGGRQLIAQQKDTRLVRRGRMFLIVKEQKATRRRGERVGPRTEVIGYLVREARNPRPLDFFGSWDRLEPQRHARYQRMLDSVAQA